jgi:outer membrane protein OmpA-like peptidoglycan-associated protein
MKYTMAFLGAAAMAALVGPASAEQMTSWYGAIEGGGNWVEDFDMQEYVTPLGPPPATSSLHLDAGWAALASLGYAYDNNWRFEVEGGYRYNQFDSITPLGGPSTPIDGDFHQFTLMANSLYDFPSDKGVTFTLGGGVGAHYAKMTSDSLSTAFDGDDVSLAFQGFAGLSVPVASWLDMSLNYRFLFVPNVKLEDEKSIAPSSAHVDIEDLKSHTVTLGFRFGSRGEPMPAPQVDAPPPPPPPVPRQYLIFFGFNKCNITAEADAVISEAASAAKTTGAASILIVGHTDTVGSNSYNQKLSDCRASATKSGLVSKGINEGQISASGRGETELLVKTGDNVKEPQNRRATIDLQN